LIFICLFPNIYFYFNRIIQLSWNISVNVHFSWFPNHGSGSHLLTRDGLYARNRSSVFPCLVGNVTTYSRWLSCTSSRNVLLNDTCRGRRTETSTKLEEPKRKVTLQDTVSSKVPPKKNVEKHIKIMSRASSTKIYQATKIFLSFIKSKRCESTGVSLLKDSDGKT
jgi:hypothetical protein